MTLAGTPASWPDGPDVSTLKTLLVFVGIPLLVIAAVYVLAYAPSWVRGSRYVASQPEDAASGAGDWFGTRPGGHAGATAVAHRGSTRAAGRASPGVTMAQQAANPAHGGMDPAHPGVRPQTGLRPSPEPGGASAGW